MKKLFLVIIFLISFQVIGKADEEIVLECIDMCRENNFQDCYKNEFKKWEDFKWEKKDIEAQIKSGIRTLTITQDKTLIMTGITSQTRQLTFVNEEYYVYLLAFPQTESEGNLQIIGINRANLNFILRNITNVSMNEKEQTIFYPESLSTNNILDSKKISLYLNNILVEFLNDGRPRDTNLDNCRVKEINKNKI